jgi:hypothetical protein
MIGDPINIRLAMAMQTATIAAQQARIEELQAENAILDKRAKGLYAEYQVLQYEIRSLPTSAEYLALRTQMLEQAQIIEQMKRTK